MIKSKEHYDEIGDLNPIRERMEVIEFPPKFQKRLEELMGVGSKCLDYIIKDGVMKIDYPKNTPSYGGFNEPLSDCEDFKFNSILNIEIHRLYHRLEGWIVEDREQYEKDKTKEEVK